MLVIGLTGSIGMGKTVTAGLFREAGIPVQDADVVVHHLYAGAAVPALDAAFPGSVVDGRVDRARLSAMVFGDEAGLARLEAIVHPLVGEARGRFLATAAAEGRRAVVLDVPLLLETRGRDLVDVVVVVSAPEAVQKARVLARPGMTAERFGLILRKQMPDAAKRRLAHFVIDSSRGHEAARRQVQAMLRATASRYRLHTQPVDGGIRSVRRTGHRVGRRSSGRHRSALG